MRSSMRKSLILTFPLLIGALLALTALSGCGPERVSSSPPTVSYNVTGNSMTQANARASSYCSNYGAVPRLLSVQDGVATYSCGAPSTATAPPTYTAPASPQTSTPRTSPISPTPAQ